MFDITGPRVIRGTRNETSDLGPIYRARLIASTSDEFLDLGFVPTLIS
jgi:hypothetical protein